MKAVAALLLLPLLASAVRLSSKVTPTEKVIAMLSEMAAKGERMMEEEQKIFSKYAEWVDDKTRELGFEIKTAAAKIEELVAFVEKADSDVEQLGLRVAELDQQIEELTAEKKEATAMRAEEHAEYVKVSADYAESVDALDRAIQVMSAENYDRGQAESLLQTMAATVPGGAGVLSAFLQQKGRAGAGEPGAPEVAAYEFQSSGVVEMLEGLLKKFKGELSDVQEAESNQKHAFEMTEMHLSDTIAKSTSDREEKSVMKGKKAASSAQAKGELAETKASKAADEELKAEIEATYKEKTAAYEQNQKVRADELEAIGKANEIIKGGAVAGSYAKRINAFVATGAVAAVAAPVDAFIQLRSTKRRVASREQAAMFLRKMGKALKSKALAALAEQVPANAFEKVIGMVEELIAKLKEEAAAEADHKAWCDEQYGETKAKTDDLRHTVDRLTSKIDKAKATSMTLKDESKDLQAALAQIAKSQAELDQLRRGQNKAYSLAKEDMETGLRGVRQAMKVLREYYEGDASESSAHAKAGGAGSTIVGMLEVIQSDLSKGLAQAEMAEDSAATEYEKVSMQNRLTVTGYEQDVKYKTKEAASLDKAVVEMSSDRDSSQTELDAVLEYSKSVRGACEVKPESYEERTSRREAEVAGLKEALSILSGEGMFLQKQKKGSLRGKH
mmetsp:Transcript_16149/g.42688  ORF Transcript_16149/g.42688 Transcript_16149/m.42688 type:complete len:674 (+) Transcript_16149:69-2090(+)